MEKLNFRDILAIVYMLIYPVIIVTLIWAAYEFGMTVLEALGIGTVIGILSTCFANMWQFYFRKKPAESNKE
jgi:hypothetical protein